MNSTLPDTFRWDRIWHIASPILGALWLAAPVVGFATTDPPGWQLATDAVFAWLFVWAGSAAGVRLSGPTNLKTVLAITVRPGLLEIADDGTGVPRSEPGGHGLTGLRERVESIGGTVEDGAGPAGGFRLVVRVP